MKKEEVLSGRANEKKGTSQGEGGMSTGWAWGIANPSVLKGGGNGTIRRKVESRWLETLMPS